MNETTWTEEEINAIIAHYGAPGVKWKTYPNDMRSDGVFIAEDKPIEPYPGAKSFDGRPLYPAVPDGPHCIEFQLPHDMAAEVVRRLNAL